MQFDLEIGGKVRSLRVHRQNGRFRVAVDDRVFDVDAQAIARDGMSLLVQEGDGPVRSLDATVSSRPGSPAFEVGLEGHSLLATVVSRFGVRAADGAPGGSGPQQVTAPMPGRVVRVLVAPGDQVAPRQGLVVIEAMKMENELRAARAGRVMTVRVVQGQSVEAGALLVSVE